MKKICTTWLIGRNVPSIIQEYMVPVHCKGINMKYIIDGGGGGGDLNVDMNQYNQICGKLANTVPLAAEKLCGFHPWFLFWSVPVLTLPAWVLL